MENATGAQKKNTSNAKAGCSVLLTFWDLGEKKTKNTHFAVLVTKKIKRYTIHRPKFAGFTS